MASSVVSGNEPLGNPDSDVTVRPVTDITAPTPSGPSDADWPALRLPRLPDPSLPPSGMLGLPSRQRYRHESQSPSRPSHQVACLTIDGELVEEAHLPDDYLLLE
jgi:hypothetical protein